MTKLIIVCGLSGVGKTTLADELSKKLKIFCLHKDSVKETFYDSLKINGLEESKKLGYPSVKAIIDLAEENLARGTDVILESPFNYPEDTKIFLGWRERYAIQIFTIILELDSNQRKIRMIKRESERHASHYDNERHLEFLEMQYDYSNMPDKKIFLTTDKPVNKLVEKVISQIRLFNK